MVVSGFYVPPGEGLYAPPSGGQAGVILRTILFRYLRHTMLPSFTKISLLISQGREICVSCIHGTTRGSHKGLCIRAMTN